MKFSVLMPVYVKENASYLELALRSITADQQLKPTEVVIVEDGPITPELDALLTRFEKSDPTIRRYRLQENQGVGKALNFGLRHITSDWVARMDSDDIARPERFAQQVAYLEANPNVQILGSSTEEFDSNPGDKHIERRLPESHEAIMKMMRMRNPINHMTVFFRRDIALKVGGYWEDAYFEDYYLWYKMSKEGARLHNLQNNLVDVRVGNNMVERRSGFGYFKKEKLLLSKFREDGFISWPLFVNLLIVKLTLRTLPVPILKWFYKTFLRKAA